MRYTKRLALLALAFCTAWLGAGCTGLHSFPVLARGGDTVFLAVGSVDGMSKDNITVTYTADSDGTVVDLTPDIQALARLYPDQLSYTSLNETNIYFKQGHEPWLKTLALNLPYSIADGGSLPVGTGKIQVSCVPRESCTVPFTVNHPNDLEIAIEIVSGTGSPHPFEYDAGIAGTDTGSPSTLQPVQHVSARATHPEGITFTNVGGPVMGAAEFEINVPASDIVGGAVPDDRFVVVSDDISTYSGSQRSMMWKRNGDVITVIYISHKGMKFTELSFSVAMKDDLAHNCCDYVYTATPTLISEKYYDMNGAQILSSPPALNVTLVD